MKDLFGDKPYDIGNVRSDDPSTSHEAAEGVDVGELKRIVLTTMLKHNGMTTAEIAWASGLNQQSVTPRMGGENQLEENGLVYRCEPRLPNVPGHISKRRQIEWRLTAKGISVARKFRG